MRAKLGGKDRGKIDQYTDAVRDVERRIHRAEAQKDRDIPALEGPGGVPSVFSDYY